MQELMSEIKAKMQKACDSLKTELGGLRTGRASANLLDKIRVDVYGSMMPINQVGSVNVPEPRSLVVSIWDASVVKNVEKAIRDSDLGLNPNLDGNTIRIRLPELTEDRRKELVKVAGKYAEDGRVAVRNIRRSGMDSLKKAKNDNEITEDEQKSYEGDVQKITDQFVAEINNLLEAKEKEITTI